jgi:hypothetical protein
MKPTKIRFERIRKMQDKICELKDEVDDHVAGVAFKYSQLNKGFNNPSSIGNFSTDWVVGMNTITCPWSDSWSYGGHDEGEVTVPLAYFYDDALFAEYIKEKELTDVLLKKRREKQERDDEKKLFEHLRKKYETK